MSLTIGSFRDPSGAPIPYPECVGVLTAQSLRQMGAAYVRGLQQRAPTAVRVTDKMPTNFFYLGLVHLMLPQSRIIHVRRDPLDTCLSCFSKLFAGEQPYAYDLAELGRYYRAYEALMEHWRRVLPEGVMLDVQYEELVADFEPQARRLLGYCGLEWDDRCLAFHETQRSVRTASATQVRQPIYGTSVGRWRPYREMLQPLLRELGSG
jgi:Sulfotransferase family